MIWKLKFLLSLVIFLETKDYSNTCIQNKLTKLISKFVKISVIQGIAILPGNLIIKQNDTYHYKVIISYSVIGAIQYIKI